MATKDEATTTDKIPTTRRRSDRRRPRPTPPAFASEAEERAWVAKQQADERAYEDAAAKYPPGSKLFVSTARGIKSRRRAGIDFADNARQEVAVVDLTDDEMAKIKAGDDTILGTTGEGDERKPDKLAVQLRSGAPMVTPTGAKSIAEDDGLTVWTGAGADPKELDDKDRRIAELEAELATANKTIASLRKAQRDPSNPAAPSRLGKSDAGSDFGGGSDTKPNG